MNWWFSHDAVLLDTAGRLMFEDIPAGTGSEWEEFLGLLKHCRPHCPINGLLLMIPADKLLTDTSEEISRKAGRIAAQFEHVQITLGIRFPVFVVITKCDLIGGFNEFFDSIDDPQRQNQMLGWSNPAKLDVEFDPKLVDQHLEIVRQRLLRRRLRLLLEPMKADDGSPRRLDQVDNLYGLPDNLVRIAPRLRQYLETVFVAGAWSQKPLFLRGIYFTSSIQKGSPYDPELATALGISVNDLPKGRSWDRVRSYFLRDLFIEKVFPEKGLVTRVGNVDSYRRRKKTAALGGGFAAILLLSALIGFSAYTLRSGIGEHSGFYADKLKPALTPASRPAIVEPGPKYANAQITGMEQPTLLGVIQRSETLAKKPIYISPVFRYLALRKPNELEDRCKQAHALFVGATVMHPILGEVRSKMQKEPGATWSDEATTSLQSLIKLEMSASEAPPSPDLGPMMKYLFLSGPRADKEAALKDALALQGAWTQASDFAPLLKPPGLQIRGGTTAQNAVVKGIDAYIAYLESSGQKLDKAYTCASNLKTALADYHTALKSLTPVAGQTLTTWKDHETAAGEWSTKIGELGEKVTAIDNARVAWDEEPLKHWREQTSTTRPADTYARRVEACQERVKNLGDILALIPDEAKTPAWLISKRKHLETAKSTAEKLIETATKWRVDDAADDNGLAKLQACLEPPPSDEVTKFDMILAEFVKQAEQPTTQPKTKPARYHLYWQLLVRANNRLSAALNAEGDITKLESQLERLPAERNAVVKAFPSTEDPPATEAKAAFVFAIATLARPIEKYRFISTVLDNLPPAKDAKPWQALVSTLAGGQGAARTKIPLIAWNADDRFDAKFDPNSVKTIQAAWPLLDTHLSAKPPVIERDSLSEKLTQSKDDFEKSYKNAYTNYWRGQLKEGTNVTAKDWPGLRGDLIELQSNMTLASKGLTKLFVSVNEALKVIDRKLDAVDVAGQASLEDEAWMKQFGVMVEAWPKLDKDPLEASRNLRSSKSSKFRGTYYVTSDGFVQNYCRNLCVKALELIGRDSKDRIEAAVKAMEGLDAFPLVRRPGVRDLTTNELGKAKEQLIILGDSGKSDEADSLAKIGLENPRKDADIILINSAIENIRWTAGLNDKQNEYLKRVSKLLNALPDPQKSISCTISCRNSSALVPVAEHLKIEQGDASLVLNLHALNDKGSDLMKFKLPGKPLIFEFGFFVEPADKGEKNPKWKNTQPNASLPDPNKNGRMSNDWSLLHLMADGRAKKVDNPKPQEWCLEYLVQEGKAPLVLIFTFDANANITPLVDWLTGPDGN
ncbi:MAG: type VI secretion system protein [Planctomycetota bacterium]|nr:type VI secretion system protein [Planctomycetota bacterium]